MSTTKSEDEAQIDLLHKVLLKGDLPKLQELLEGKSRFEQAKQLLALRSRLLLSMGTGPVDSTGQPDINGRDAEGKTPALQTRSFETFQLIVKAGGDPLARDNAGRSAFDLAIERKEDAMAVAILQQFHVLVPPEAVNAAFVHAVRQGCTGVVKKLAEMGADLGQKPGGRTLLQCAPRGAEELKRVLRSLKSSAAIASAMGAQAEPSCGRSSLTL